MTTKQLKPEYPVVALYAFDWAGPDSTIENYSNEELDECLEPVYAWIVGMVVKETPEYLVIVQQHFPETGNHRCPIAIAKATVKKRVDFK